MEETTLEERREMAMRQLYARLTAAQEDRRLYRGVVAASQGGGQVQGYTSWRNSVTDRNNELKPSAETHAWDLAPIKKRTDTERLDSMIRRLKDMPPGMQAATLIAIEAEFWKLGAPVTGEVLKAAAAKLLGQAEKEKQ
jgi:hypothetical protein